MSTIKKIVLLIALLIPASIVIPLFFPRTINIEIVSQGGHDKSRKEQITAITQYFTDRNMPLADYSAKMVEEAEKNGIDWRLLPAIAVRESSGGKEACGFNPFGWNSCKGSIGTFDSWDHGIEVVARNIGGNNPNTAGYYSGKDVKGILETYNPPSVAPNYAAQVMAIMAAIGEE